MMIIFKLTLQLTQGNSGGPLFDMNGDVIGINTAIIGSVWLNWYRFSIPSNSAKKVIESINKIW